MSYVSSKSYRAVNSISKYIALIRYGGDSIMELWYTEQHTENVRFTIKVDRHLYSSQSEFQRIDIMESYGDPITGQ